MSVNLKLSDHFSLDEFVVSQVAIRNGIDNEPSELIVENIKKICLSILEPARIKFGPIKISSGYRCKALNSLVGGSATSDHVFGLAVDIIPLMAKKLDVARWIRDNCEFDQIILEYGTLENPAWVHIGVGSKMRKELLRAPGYKKIVI